MMSTRFSERPEWQAVRAVRDRRFLRLTESALKWPSPRAPMAIAALRRRLQSAGPSNASVGTSAHVR
jgi:hypothetical protein